VVGDSLHEILLSRGITPCAECNTLRPEMNLAGPVSVAKHVDYYSERVFRNVSGLRGVSGAVVQVVAHLFPDHTLVAIRGYILQACKESST
jgi:hypothetical protein